MTLVGDPVVDHANEAVVEAVDAAGADVIDTVGAGVPDGGGVEPESRSVPKSCVQ